MGSNIDILKTHWSSFDELIFFFSNLDRQFEWERQFNYLVRNWLISHILKIRPIIWNPQRFWFFQVVNHFAFIWRLLWHTEWWIISSEYLSVIRITRVLTCRKFCVFARINLTTWLLTLSRCCRRVQVMRILSLGELVRLETALSRETIPIDVGNTLFWIMTIFIFFQFRDDIFYSPFILSFWITLVLIIFILSLQHIVFKVRIILSLLWFSIKRGRDSIEHFVLVLCDDRWVLEGWLFCMVDVWQIFERLWCPFLQGLVKTADARHYRVLEAMIVHLLGV